MDTHEQGRSVRPNGEAIRRLRMEKGWHAHELARHAQCSEKTIQAAERGDKKDMKTVASIAQALGVTYQSLLWDSVPDPATAPQKRRLDIQITLSMPFDVFGAKQLADFMDLLKERLPARDQIQVKAVTEGSVVLKVEMSEDDIESLIDAYNKGRLDDLKVVSIAVADAEGEFVSVKPDAPSEQIDRLNSYWTSEQGQRLVGALQRANGRAWDTLELALAGESLWDRCSAVFARAEDKAFRDQVRGFLDCLPPGLFDAKDTEVRRLALAELRFARKEGALHVPVLDVRQLGEKVGGLTANLQPQALWDAETKALVEIADSFPGEQYAHLRRILRLKSRNGEPLLSAAVRFFFRREIESDRELFQGLSLSLSEQTDESLERGFGYLEVALKQHPGRMEQLVSEATASGGK